MHAENKGLTFINSFTVEPEKQQELLDLLARASEQTMRYLPGFRSARVYRGLDGTSVANYVEWRSVEDFERMLQQPGAQQHIAEIRKITRGNPQRYELYQSIEGLSESAGQLKGQALAAEHEVLISKPWKDCFELCSSLDRWHEFMPAVRAAQVLWERNGDQEIQIQADFNGQVVTWRSRREVAAELRLIRFWSLTPRHPIKALTGTWFFEPTGPSQTRVRVSHRFELVDPAQESVVRAGIGRNMTGDLQGMKNYLEKIV